jgi:hypothetical protein
MIRTRVLPALTMLVGLALVVRALVDADVLGIIIGVLFVALGAGRLYLEANR